MVLNDILKFDVENVFCTRPITRVWSNPLDHMQDTASASVAEFERELIRERVRAGIRSAKHKGKQLGRKRIIFDRAKVIEIQAADASIREIAAQLTHKVQFVGHIYEYNSTTWKDC